MAELTINHGKVGVEPMVRRGIAPSYRLWIDRGRGKYGAIEISDVELRELLKMMSGVMGGSQLKPTRKFVRKA